MFTSLSAAVQYVKCKDLKPFYLLTEDAKRDFGVQTTENSSAEATMMTTTAESNDGNENSVVVGLAPDKFVYETINKAFRYACYE